MLKKWLLGKIFISHSAKDKPFVRRLAQRLWKEGYQVWLDEKELVPGDALAARLSDALAQSRVVIVVVTQNSVGSRWLQFELNKAAERMVNGRCRIIPVLKGTVEPPNELKGLIYADFRKTFANGFGGVLSALSAEADDAARDSWAATEIMVHEAFDAHGFSSSMGEYDSFDCEFVELRGVKDPDHSRDDDNANIVYDVIHDYLGKKEPLNEHWWSEYLDSRDRYPALFHLVVSERPISSLKSIKLADQTRNVGFFIRRNFSPIVIVMADLSNATATTERRIIIERARQELRRIAKELNVYHVR
jgi:hypothetical protein